MNRSIRLDISWGQRFTFFVVYLKVIVSARRITFYTIYALYLFLAFPAPRFLSNFYILKDEEFVLLRIFLSVSLIENKDLSSRLWANGEVGISDPLSETLPQLFFPLFGQSDAVLLRQIEAHVWLFHLNVHLPTRRLCIGVYTET